MFAFFGPVYKPLGDTTGVASFVAAVTFCACCGEFTFVRGVVACVLKLTGAVALLTPFFGTSFRGFEVLAAVRGVPVLLFLI